MTDCIIVSRSVDTGGVTITESVQVSLPDDLLLDAGTESIRRAVLSEMLFRSLPSMQPITTCPPHPTNLQN